MRYEHESTGTCRAAQRSVSSASRQMQLLNAHISAHLFLIQIVVAWRARRGDLDLAPDTAFDSLHILPTLDEMFRELSIKAALDKLCPDFVRNQEASWEPVPLSCITQREIHTVQRREVELLVCILIVLEVELRVRRRIVVQREPGKLGVLEVEEERHRCTEVMILG